MHLLEDVNESKNKKHPTLVWSLCDRLKKPFWFFCSPAFRTIEVDANYRHESVLFPLKMSILGMEMSTSVRVWLWVCFKINYTTLRKVNNNFWSIYSNVWRTINLKWCQAGLCLLMWFKMSCKSITKNIIVRDLNTALEAHWQKCCAGF